jgi:formyl-CoA transferase/CoA:oxalate CoA-transferase
MRPLDGLVVIDFTRVLSGPYCTMQLADLGARVIKIEQPLRGDDTRGWGPPFVAGESAYFLSINRNKESLTLDLKHERAREVVDGLLARADVLVENFRPGTMEKLDLGYDRVGATHPRLVYCSISGFGQSGPRSQEAGYDAVMQAEGGLMSVTGSEDGPPYRLGVAIADLATGLFAAQGVLAALIARTTTGRGQRVDIAMLDSVAALLTYQAGIYFATGATPGRLGNRHPTIVPYETFRSADGELVIAVGNDDQFRRLCKAIGVPDLASDERFATNAGRVRNYAVLKPALDLAIGSWKRSDLLTALTTAGVPGGDVRTVAETLRDPQIAARDMIATLQHPTAGPLRVLGTPLKLSETQGDVRTPPPTLGQHTDAILKHDLGLSDAHVRALRESGAVCSPRSGNALSALDEWEKLFEEYGHDVVFRQVGDGCVLVDNPFGAECPAAAASGRSCDDHGGIPV